MHTYTKKEQRSIIFAINIGNILEWYEVFLYIYWAPLISKVFFDPSSEASSLIKTFLVFALGYVIRPLGGIFFGWVGDRIGRRKSLLWSILLMTFPTLIMAFLPSYVLVGSLAPLFLTITRILQSFPAGGELPGAFCYLYESADANQRKYFTSWGFLGSQVGIILSVAECLLLENLLYEQDLITWGWRLSFIIGALIGFLGFYLRYKLKETPFWEELEKHNKITKRPFLDLVKNYKSKILKGIAFCLLSVVSFAVLSSLFPVYFNQVLGTSYSLNLTITLILLIMVTIPLTFFGKLGDKYNYKHMMIGAILSLMFLIAVMRIPDIRASLFLCIILAVVIALLFSCLYALLPYLLANLFPTYLRFTGVGLSYNLADSVLGGFTPVVALYLLPLTGREAAYFWIMEICALISLGAFLTIKDKECQINLF